LVSDGIIDEKDLVFDPTIDMPDTPAVRDMISLYARQMGELTPKCDENWKTVGAKPGPSRCRSHLQVGA
jgi:hypothetical protein